MLLRLPHAVPRIAGRRYISTLSPSPRLHISTAPAASYSPFSSCKPSASTHFSFPKPIGIRFCSSTPVLKLKMASENPETTKEVRKYLKQTHDRIFDNNKKWAEEMRQKKPEFFKDLSAGQAPEYLWIGCSDSRIPAEAITGLDPGEMFIHRNIANLVNNIDLNVMSVVNYAVRHLKVKHIIVCGHYGCGGVKAAMTPQDLGILNPWLRNIRDVYRLHQAELDQVTGEKEKYDRLVEFNVIEQCRNVIKTAAVQQCWAENEFPVVHGWVFGFEDGLLKDLKFDHEANLKEIQKIYDLTKGF